MKPFAIILIVFWVIVIAFPAILVFLIWWFFIFLWLNLLAFFSLFKKNKWEKDSYVKFWNYKIYRNKNEL